MNPNELGRRGFLCSIVGGGSLSLATGKAVALPSYDRERVAVDSIVSVSESLGNEPSVDDGIVETAQLIAPIYQTTRADSEKVFGEQASVVSIYRHWGSA